MTLSDEEVDSLPGRAWAIKQNPSMTGTKMNSMGNVYYPERMPSNATSQNQFIRTEKTSKLQSSNDQRLSTTFDPTAFAGPSRSPRRASHMFNPIETPHSIETRDTAFSLGDVRSMPAKRYASSPLAGQSGMPRFSNMSQAMQRTPPPIHLAGGAGNVERYQQYQNSLNANPFSYSPILPSNNSPTTMARRSSPLSSSSLLRSPNGSAVSRRRFSENSFGLGTSQGLQTPNFGSLVGSYEESLLNGRMSSLPSKPLVFDAELGVLGLGKCKTSLKCPPHVNFKFPAYFYSLEGAVNKEGKTSSTSPYVGTIDLESYYMDQLFEPIEDSIHSQKEESGTDLFSQTEEISGTNGSMKSYPMSLSSTPSGGIPFARRSHRSSKQTKRPQFPGYRVPPKGQVQLVIKNPNLTAVKVFLVPYDLTDMPAGTKTFVRQKCHVAPPTTPTIESVSTFPLSANGSPSNSSIRPPPARETLRYAVHLQFCAVQGPVKLSKAGFEGENRFERDANGDRVSIKKQNRHSREERSEPRIYLHKSIRVVFSARVPDKSEKLTNATETPKGAQGEGMYSTYNGPSEEWQRARMMAKEREFAAHHYPHSNRVEVDESNSNAVFHHTMANSDPNGERWEERYMAMENADMGDIEMQLESEDGISFGYRAEDTLGHNSNDLSRASWNRKPTDSRPSSADAQSIHENLLANHVSRSTSRSRATSINTNPLTNTFLTSSSPSMPSNYDHKVNEDKTMLENWHATLAARANQQQQTITRSTSPTKMRSRPTSPPPSSEVTDVQLQINVPSSSSSIYSNNLRGGSNSLRNLQNQRSTEGYSFSSINEKMSLSSPALSPIPSMTTMGMQNVLSPRLSAASIETEHANGVMMSISDLQIDEMRLDSSSNSIEGVKSEFVGKNPSSTNLPLRPSLMRRLSSQASQAALSSSGRDSPSSLQHAQSQPTTASSIFTWRQSINRNGFSNDEVKD